MTLIYFAAPDWAKYEAELPRALAQAGIAAQIITAPPPNPALVDFIVYAPSADLQNFSPYTGCKAVLSLWAGVERIVSNPTLTQPLCRMVDAGLTMGMTEWVCGHVLRHHLGMDAHIINPNQSWRAVAPPLARDRCVAMLGMGALGLACARALATLNFNIAGWSRSGGRAGEFDVAAGEDGLRAVLGQADFIVALLPKTPQTENLLNAQTLSWAKRGAVLLNAGRGTLIEDAALLAALKSGQISAAVLDVFRTEPLPPTHPFWHAPQITITPHIAAETRPSSASAAVAENIRRAIAGEPLLHLAQPARGY